jgi:polynucleotide 5'-hydroxyl-kinase GRC3/NOL9
VVSGKVEVFCDRLKQTTKIVVREGKRLPFFVLEKAIFDVWLGPNASIEEVDGTTIPESWSKPVEAILSLQQKPVVVLLLGKNDSGKSSFCIYLVNRLVDGKCRVAVLDGDLGQSDIGSSGTVGYAIISKPIAVLTNLRLQNAVFVGVTSPIKAIAKTIDGLADLKAEILEKQVNYLIINSDGWVKGDDAVDYKLKLINKLKPDVLVGVQVEDELRPLIANLDDRLVILVDPSSSLSQRNAEKRKSLREMTYARYTKNAKLHCYPLSQLTIEPRASLPKFQEREKGLLVGLYGSGSKFLGIGVLREINQVRKALKVQTTVSVPPKRLVFGKIILDRKLQEVQD